MRIQTYQAKIHLRWWTGNTGFQRCVSGAVGGVSGFWRVMGRERYDASQTCSNISGGLGVNLVRDTITPVVGP
jgi:hypothetical protein